MRRSLLLFLILACSPAYAELIKVVAAGNSISYSDPSALLSFPAPPAGSVMTLTFLYDSDTADVHSDPNVGVYAGAISNLTLSIAGTTLSTLPENAIIIRNDSPNDGNGDGVPDGIVDSWIATTYLIDSSHRTEISLLLFRTTGDAIDSDALVAPGDRYTPGLNLIFHAIRDRSDPDNPVILADAQTFVDSLNVTVVPVPASSLLLLPCLLAIAPRLRRRTEQG